MADQEHEQFEKVPRHLAIIMDGNGRWAKARGASRREGHQAGTENLRVIIRACVEFGIEILTLYAFSTENWNRSRWEVRALMHILESVIEKELDELHQEGVQIRHIGQLDRLASPLQRKIRDALQKTQHNTRLVLNVALSYGGRDEIVRAIRRIVAEDIPPDKIDEALVSDYLDTAGLPDPDLIIRTSGEMRVSNFLVWQGVYTEYYATPIFWPDFGREELREALRHYSQRERRFGALMPQH